jgi:hypothetical protein
VTDQAPFDIAGWQSFLQSWDAQVRDLLSKLPPPPHDPVTAELMARGSILRDGANEDDIRAAAKRFGRELPESLKRFYRVSNGLIVPMLDVQDALLFAVQQLSYLRDSEPTVVILGEAEAVEMSDEEYLRYGRGQDPLSVSSKYWRGLVQLSSKVDSAVLALNPDVVTTSGEWEAWHIAFEAPGTYRYPSFEAMMVELRDQTLQRMRDLA